MSDAQQDKGGGAGAIGDAPSAFEDQLMAAAKALASAKPPAADPKVTAALQLGWVMGSLVSSVTQTPLPAGFPIETATLYKARAIELRTLVGAVGVTVSPPVDALATSLSAGVPATVEAGAWESSLVASLLGAGVSVAKAYGVGRTLNGLAYGSVAMGAPDVLGLIDALDDLSSSLPPHAARGVANSVRVWQQAPLRPEAEVLTAQCELWRTVLTGEKLATQLLEPENYIDAAEQLTVKLRATGAVLLRQNMFWIALAVLVAIAATLLLVRGAAGQAIAGISSLLVALGVTWRTIGVSLGGLAAHVEADLWGGEVDNAVTAAITLKLVGTAGTDASRPVLSLWHRRRSALGGDYAGRSARRPGIDPAQGQGDSGTGVTPSASR